MVSLVLANLIWSIPFAAMGLWFGIRQILVARGSLETERWPYWASGPRWLMTAYGLLILVGGLLQAVVIAMRN